MVVLRFLDWMERAPATLRAEAVGPLVRTYLFGDLSAAERDAVDSALTLLLDDPAPTVRVALAEAIARHETAPRHILVALTHDLPAVAEPIFRHSPCLLESELLEGVSGGGPRLQAAIAARPWVSFEVSAALAGEGCRDAVLALLRNTGSDLDETAFRRMADRFAADGDIRDAMFDREELPIAIRQGVIAGLGNRLNAFLVDREWLTERRASAVVREATDKATVVLAADAGEEDLTELVAHLRASGQLTTAFLLRCAVQGHLRVLEAAFACLSDVPERRVFALITEGRAGALGALMSKAGLPERTHPAFLVALQAWREVDYDGSPGDRARTARRMIERILTRYQGFDPAEVDDLIALMRRLGAEAAREAARAFRDDLRARGAVRLEPEDVVVAA